MTEIELEKRIIPFPQKDIVGIVIKNDELEAEIKKEEDKWMLISPIYTKADNDAISSMLTAIIGGMRKKSLTDVGDKLSEYGFGEDAAFIEFKSDKTDSPMRLLFGEKTSVPFEIYAKIDNEKSVFVVDEMIKNAIDKSLYDLRDKTIIAIVPEDVKRMSLVSSAGEIVCEQEEKDRIWNITKPGEYKGDRTAIEDIIRKINSSKIRKFVEPDEETEEEVDFKQYGLDTPIVELELTKNDNSQYKLLIGNIDQETQNYYAKLDSSNQIFEVEEALVTELSASLTKVRDKTLFDFQVDNVERVVVKSPKGLIDANKKDDKWLLTNLDNKEAQDSKVTDMLYEIKGLKVGEFTGKQIDEIEDSGLDKPDIEIQVYTMKSEDDEGKEAPSESNVLKIGNIAMDLSKVYAKYDKIDEVVLLNKEVLGKFNKSSDDVMDKRLLKFNPSDVQQLKISTKEKEINLEQKDSKWIVASEENKTANAMKVMSILWKLGELEYITEFKEELGDKYEDYCTVTILESEKNETKELSLKVNKENANEVIAIIDSKKYKVSPKIKSDIPQDANFFFD